MYGRAGLDRFRKAQSLEPFSVKEAVPPPPLAVGQIGEGQSTWQPPEWAMEPRPGVYYLQVLKEGQLVERITLDKRRNIFGRQSLTCDYVLDHQSVSRQHAALVPHKNGRSVSLRSFTFRGLLNLMLMLLVCFHVIY